MPYKNHLLGPAIQAARDRAKQRAHSELLMRRTLNKLTFGMSDVLNAEVRAMKAPGGLGGLPQRFTNALADEREITRTGKPLDRSPVKIPPKPPGVSVDDDMREAARRRDPLWFFNQVKGHGPWDYKYRDGDTRKYDPYGNFVFGAAGTALGLSPDILRRGSGAAQIAGDAIKAAQKGKLRIDLSNGVPWGEHPYGNQADDQPFIDLGIRYAREPKY